MTRIALITTGGTIASRIDPRLNDTVANLAGDALRARLHDPLPGIDLVVDEFSTIGSSAMELSMSFALAARIRHHIEDPDCDGVVVTHGTDTMEESVYLADLTVGSDKPVVFTGAQRPADAPDSDGPRNIAEAVRLAAAPQAAGLGAMILFEQDFHAARDVTKTHTSRVDTFTSGEHGKLGEIDGEAVLVFRRPVLRKAYPAQSIEPAVDLIRLAMGQDDRLIRYAAASGAKALVVEAFGRGNATPVAAKAIADLIAAGVPVIICSRCPQGRVRPIYGNGGGRDLERAGAIFAGDLTGQKARILAAVLLGMGLGPDDIRQEFAVLAG